MLLFRHAKNLIRLPITGTRSVDSLKENIEALSVSLTPGQVKRNDFWKQMVPYMSSISKEESFALFGFSRWEGIFWIRRVIIRTKSQKRSHWRMDGTTRSERYCSRNQAFYKPSDPNVHQHINFVGNNIKNILKKLRTSYINILYVHWWDWDTSIKEVIDRLHRLVLDGKLLYLGILGTPAWIVSQANQYAECQGKTPFSIYQGKCSALNRSFERDIIPMARMNGMALAPWGVIGGGRLRTNEEELVKSLILEKVANEIGAYLHYHFSVPLIIQFTNLLLFIQLPFSAVDYDGLFLSILDSPTFNSDVSVSGTEKDDSDDIPELLDN
ncbi:Aldo/keto reductase [Dendrothele bispora CBS 962.96]|uniref:Aldo/keto reductase n=1 Tax=Dendrothele bispora (strain CBS 962.96) TaxID=1314807 RepID=A0A4S8LU10_DENBC|nr:Aldo/keto reductase [Dendrothele bispora CBS 962.96]